MPRVALEPPLHQWHYIDSIRTLEQRGANIVTPTQRIHACNI